MHPVPYHRINLFSPDDLWMTSWPLVYLPFSPSLDDCLYDVHSSEKSEGHSPCFWSSFSPLLLLLVVPRNGIPSLKYCKLIRCRFLIPQRIAMKRSVFRTRLGSYSTGSRRFDGDFIVATHRWGCNLFRRVENKLPVSLREQHEPREKRRNESEVGLCSRWIGIEIKLQTMCRQEFINNSWRLWLILKQLPRRCWRGEKDQEEEVEIFDS